MGQHALLGLLTASGLALGGCGNSPGASADGGGQEEPFGCEEAPLGGEQFAIELGARITGEDAFVALSEGDALPVVLGFQGVYMTTIRVRAAMAAPAEAEELCLACVAAVGPGGSFEGVSQSESTRFTEGDDGLYTGLSTILLGSQIQLENGEAIDGQEVELRMSCDGHGFSGEGLQTVLLDVVESE